VISLIEQRANGELHITIKYRQKSVRLALPTLNPKAAFLCNLETNR
jgi:hypothetical protein